MNYIINEGDKKFLKKTIYRFIIEEWSGISNVKNSDKEPCFSKLVDDIVESALVDSFYLFDNKLIVYLNKLKIERQILNDEFFTKSFESKELDFFEDKLKIISKENESFNIITLNKKILENIKKNYKNINQIVPKKYKNISNENLSDLLLEIKKTKTERHLKFKGFSVKYNESMHFVDAITGPVVFYNELNGITPIESVIGGISSYVVNFQKNINTIKIKEKVLNIELAARDSKRDKKDKIFFFQFGSNQRKKNRQEKIIRNELDLIFKKNNH